MILQIPSPFRFAQKFLDPLTPSQPRKRRWLLGVPQLCRSPGNYDSATAKPGQTVYNYVPQSLRPYRFRRATKTQQSNIFNLSFYLFNLYSIILSPPHPSASATSHSQLLIKMLQYLCASPGNLCKMPLDLLNQFPLLQTYITAENPPILEHFAKETKDLFDFFSMFSVAAKLRPTSCRTPRAWSPSGL